MKYKVKITREILKKTANRDNWDMLSYQRCPIEVALSDIFPNAMVTQTDILIEGACHNKSIRLPIEARQFIKQFDFFSSDERINMLELEFDINIQEEMINHE